MTFVAVWTFKKSKVIALSLGYCIIEMNRKGKTEGFVIEAKVVITPGLRVNAVKRVETCSLSIGGQAQWYRIQCDDTAPWYYVTQFASVERYFESGESGVNLHLSLFCHI